MAKKFGYIVVKSCPELDYLDTFVGTIYSTQEIAESFRQSLIEEETEENPKHKWSTLIRVYKVPA